METRTKVRNLRERGLSYNQIAKILNISKQRVGQIVTQYKSPNKWQPPAEKKREYENRYHKSEQYKKYRREYMRKYRARSK